MNITGFTDTQKERLLDILLLGMYSDAHVARSEEARVQKLLDALHFPSSHARNQYADVAIARVRDHLAAPGDLAGIIARMESTFSAPDVRRKAVEALDEILASDSKMTSHECEFLASVRKAFGC